MPKFTDKERQYDVSLTDGTITIKCIELGSLKGYVCNITNTYFENCKLIDNVENLYDFIVETFESGDKFETEFIDGNIELSSIVFSRYKTEKYKFVLKENNNVNSHKELQNSLTLYQKKVIDLEDSLHKLELLFMTVFQTSYIRLPNNDLIKSAVNLLEVPIPDIRVRYDDKIYNLMCSSFSPSIIKLSDSKCVRDVLSHCKKGVTVLTLEECPDNFLNDLIPADFNIDMLCMNNMANIVDYDSVKLSKPCNVWIRGTYKSTINWIKVANSVHIKKLYIKSKLPICGMMPKGTTYTHNDYYNIYK